ncbi:Tubulin-specific chaperone C [Myotis brandtii]|uniref:Tubulin-specific chaperone C n=1 Tax=Myotis brandtii TaxID=109478 RepID=S7QFB8_MYOBR|nr:PREDICTED: tubulin-specific chaperone C [Myotis brandtii]EPQ19952.1 Tubulin-specific chaperone C [Myotis brandtii]
METANCSAAVVGNGDVVSQRERSLLPERLQRRDQERQLEAERRKQKRQDQEVVEEKSDFFTAAFARERAAVEELLQGGESVERLEEAAARLQGLQKLLNDSVLFLAAYEVRQAQEALAQLQAALADRRQQLQPKKRFAFKTRRKDVVLAPKVVDAAPGAAVAEGTLASPPSVTEEGALGSSWLCGFSNLKSQVLEKRAEELHQRDVLLTELSDCTIRLYGNPNTLRLSKARRCTLLCGPVSTSVFLDDCSECVLAVACQQLRVHTTRDTRIFLQVTCRAIVEDCHGIRFAPYTWTYPGIDRDFESSGLDRSKNNWSDVDDFNWLARDMASPNWSVLPEEERTIQGD